MSDYTDRQPSRISKTIRDGKPCVFAVCFASKKATPPIWGQSDKSVYRALFTLDEICKCGNRHRKVLDK